MDVLGSQPQVAAAKSLLKMDFAGPSVPSSSDTSVVRDGGTSLRFHSKPWLSGQSVVGALLAWVFNAETRSVAKSKSLLRPPFQRSPLDYYEILLI